MNVFQYDSHFLKQNTGHDGAADSVEIALYYEDFRKKILDVADKVVIKPARKGTAALLPACYKHTNTLGGTFSTLKTNGFTFEQALADWFFDGKDQYVVEQC